MSLVAHKYTPAEMSDHELEATFAAREHTVDYLVKALRDQMRKGTLSSYVITGPRGAGKSTIIQMVDLRIRQDADLSAAWMPVIFPEEQFNLISLRDMLAATLQILAKQNIATAQTWLDKVEAEPDEEQSEQLAVTGLREIARQIGKRFVLFIENLNHLLEDHLDDKMKGTLRRLLMSDTFMMIVGSTVHVFDALKKYDEAFFNYFGQVPLNRLDAEQVSELLRKRATYDQNERFLRELPQQQAKVKTLVHLTGGNPRFVLMLYELLSLQQVTTIVQQLKRLVDELTPLLKDEMENLPPQQRKIIHALMERGGTAQPTDLTGPTRLPLNAITTQLKRLKEAQIVEVLGGGKGRAANYTVPDKLFSLWYQMRYLGQNRRRIELFVEVLRVWFEADERMDTLRKLSRGQPSATPQALRDSAMTAEYLAASLKNSTYAQAAMEMCVNHWITTDLHEAALAYADLSSENAAFASADELAAQLGLSDWLAQHGDFGNVIKALNEVIAKSDCTLEKRAQAVFNRGLAKYKLGDLRGAIIDYSAAIELEGAPKEQVAMALINRGIAKGQLGDTRGTIIDYSAVIELERAPQKYIAIALVNRGIAKNRLDDTQGAMTDYSAAIRIEDAPKAAIAKAFLNRGFYKSKLGDIRGEIADYSAIIELEQAPKEQIAKALVNRGIAKGQLGDTQNAIADFSAVIQLEGVSKDPIARALFNRAVAKRRLGDMQGAIVDYSTVIELEGAPKEEVAESLVNRGVARSGLGDTQGAIADYSTAIELEGAPKEQVEKALFNRAIAKHHLGDTQGAIADYTILIELENVSNEQIARALVNRGIDKSNIGDVSGAIADYAAVIEMKCAPKEQLAKALFARWISTLKADPDSLASSDLLQVISSGITTDDLMSDAAAFAILVGPFDDMRTRTETVLQKFSEALSSFPNKQARETALRFLNVLARPGMEENWPSILQGLVVQLNPEVAEAVRFLEPVGSVLEGKDRTLLDALPPEQREFALEVLAKFEPKPEPKSEKPQKANYGKRHRSKK